MRWARRFGLPLALLLAVAQCLWAPATVGAPVLPPQSKSEVTVWAIASSKIYHCHKSRWYGKGTGGKSMGECQAIREGYSPAFGVGCGSDCK